MPNQPLRCPSCGQENDPDSAFCESCGARLELAAQPARQPAQPSSSTAQPSRRRLSLVPLIVVVVGAVAITAVYLLVRSQRPDPLMALLVSTPLPEAAYPGWSIAFEPSTSENPDLEPGQVGEVLVHFSQSGGDGTASFGFAVFRTPDQARASYAEGTAYDQEHFPKFPAEQLAQLRESVITPTGYTGSCLPGGSRAPALAEPSPGAR